MGKRVVETASGAKVRYARKKLFCHRSASIVTLGTETVVAPAEDGSEEDDDNDYDSADGAESDEDGMETDGRLGTQHGERATICSHFLRILIYEVTHSDFIITSRIRGVIDFNGPRNGDRQALLQKERMNQNPNSFHSSVRTTTHSRLFLPDHHDKAS
ncbi:hypothetical protein NC651_005337 [Populus alba x Populus x berolinensis]|nr:hypothetical protein NC651_005337 [Populus alba x Populus x berolinensis]